MTDEGVTQFSLTGFVVAVVTISVGTVAGLATVPVVGSYLGMFLGGFVAGLTTKDRPLLEAGFAAVLASLGVLLAGTLIGNGIVAAVSALASIAPTTLLTSTALSFAVGAFGAHFGDDLRSGLTDPVEAPQSGSTSHTSAASPPEDDELTTPDNRDEAESTDDDTVTHPEETSTSHGAERGESDDLELERE
ncbi:MAG: YrzE family protein [Halobacteriales archaeon]